MPKKVEIEILDTAVTTDYTILAVDKIYVSVSSRKGTMDRRADVTLVPPIGKEMRIAFPNYAGVGPAPEGTVSIQAIYDRIYGNLMEIESAIRNAENSETNQSTW